MTYDTVSGEIYDADIEVNSNPSTEMIATGDPVGANKYDLQSIFQHEEGHFLGLAHTQGSNSSATMYFEYNPGETNKRHPIADDSCGLCNIYPPGRSALCNSEPRRGWATECGGVVTQPIPAGNCNEQPPAGCKCSVPGAPSRTFGAGILGLAAIALTAAASRRRRR
ncbi:MAG: matrixin family metalloprotease [Polyangiales bacterium]